MRSIITLTTLVNYSSGPIKAMLFQFGTLLDSARQLGVRCTSSPLLPSHAIHLNLPMCCSPQLPLPPPIKTISDTSPPSLSQSMPNPSGRRCSCPSPASNAVVGGPRCPQCLAEASDPESDLRGLRRCLVAAGKGFAIGAGLKGGLALFSILVRLRTRRSATSFPRNPGAITNAEAVVTAAKETLRYGLFLGAFAGTFVSVDEVVAAVAGHQRTAGWRALLAGAIAGPSLLLTGADTQHTSLAIYILMRAAVLASRCGIKSQRFGNVCKPLTWSQGDIFLMCLSSSQILSAYILKQESLPSSYKPFLNKHGGKVAVILQGVKEIASNIPFTNLEGIQKHYKSIGVDVNLDSNMKVPCSIVHGNQSCSGHFISFLLQAYRRALPVYLPVYLVPALIVHRQDLLKRPSTILGKSLLGTARSSLFLSFYCSSAWAWTCLLFKIFQRCSIPMVAMGTFPPGLALLIEKKSRRLEISLYCLARAIESFFTCMSDLGLCPQASRIKRADVAVFSLSTAIIMHCYARERDVFRSKYLNVLDWVFGLPLDCHSGVEKRGLHIPSVEG